METKIDIRQNDRKLAKNAHNIYSFVYSFIHFSFRLFIWGKCRIKEKEDIFHENYVKKIYSINRFFSHKN